MSESSPKQGVHEKLDRGFAAFADFCGRHPWLVLLATLALLIWGFAGASRAQQDNSMDSFFDVSDPSYADYKGYIEEFSSDEVIYILYRAPDKEHGIFDLEVMADIAELTESLAREVPFARKATSLSNVEFMYADGDDLVIEGMLEDFPQTQQELLRYRDIALSKPAYINTLISKDGEYGGIAVEMTRTSTDPIDKLRHDPEGGDQLGNLYPQASNTVAQNLIEPLRAKGVEFWVSGDVPMNAEYNEVIADDIGIMSLANILALIPLCWLFVRMGWVSMVAPLAVVMLSMTMTIGLLGWLGWSINMFFVMVPPLLIAVGVAQAVHVLLAWRQSGGDASDALKTAISKVGTPCLLAAVTTSIGFLGMSVSDMKAVAELAWYTAFGILCTFIFSMSLLVAIAARYRGAIKPVDQSALINFCRKLAAWVIDRQKTVLLVSAIIIAWAAFGIYQLKVDFNFMEEFKEDNPWRLQTEKINDTMGGLLSVVYVFRGESAGDARNLELLQLIDQAQAMAEQHPAVQDSTAITDVIKELNKAFHGDQNDYYRLPDSEQMLAQLLLVYEVSGGEDIDDVLNFDRSATALQLRLKMAPASEVRDLLNGMDAYFAKHPVNGIEVETSGIGLLWVRMADYISSTQIQGYSLVFGLITLVMIFAFGSVRVGILGMVPNLFPIVLCLGLMGWMHWHLDYLRLMMATIAIGIAVDDTIHMVSRLRHEFMRSGNYQTAVTEAMAGVGPALVATTVILTLSFMSFLLSGMAVMASFGVLLALAIVAALLADLFLLPVLVLKLRPFGPEFKTAAV